MNVCATENQPPTEDPETPPPTYMDSEPSLTEVDLELDISDNDIHERDYDIHETTIAQLPHNDPDPVLESNLMHQMSNSMPDLVGVEDTPTTSPEYISNDQGQAHMPLLEAVQRR